MEKNDLMKAYRELKKPKNSFWYEMYKDYSEKRNGESEAELEELWHAMGDDY